MSFQEKLDFTNSLLIEFHERKNYEILIPALQFLSSEGSGGLDIKRTLLKQIKPLLQAITEKFGNEGYKAVARTMMLILEKLIKDADEMVRD